MKSIFLLFWRICIFQSGPETVPSSNSFVIMVIAVNALLNVVVQLLLGGDEGSLLRAVTLAVVSLAGTGGLIWFIMALMQLGSRVPQTITAVFGVDIIMTTITSILFAVAGSIEENIAVFVISLLTLWSLAIYGFIFHRAMNLHIGFGIALALFVVIFSVAITQTAISA
jgi:hypothetical protein